MPYLRLSGFKVPKNNKFPRFVRLQGPAQGKWTESSAFDLFKETIVLSY